MCMIWHEKYTHSFPRNFKKLTAFIYLLMSTPPPHSTLPQIPPCTTKLDLMIPHSMLNLLISNFPPHKLKTCSCTWYMFTKRKHHEAVSQSATSSDSKHLMCSTKKIDPPSYLWHNKVIWCQKNQFCNLLSSQLNHGVIGMPFQQCFKPHHMISWSVNEGCHPSAPVYPWHAFSVLPLQSSGRGYLFLHEAVATMSWS